MSVRTATELLEREWGRRSVAVLVALVVCAPAFVWATERTGYAEPLDVAVELTGAAHSATVFHEGLLPGYTVPAFGTYTGTLVAAVLGTALTFCVTIVLGTLLEE